MGAIVGDHTKVFHRTIWRVRYGVYYLQQYNMLIGEHVEVCETWALGKPELGTLEEYISEVEQSGGETD